MSNPGGDQEKDGPSEDNIRVVCRFRPLNTSEEKAGSKFVVKFPSGSDDQCVSIGVSVFLESIKSVIKWSFQLFYKTSKDH